MAGLNLNEFPALRIKDIRQILEPSALRCVIFISLYLIHNMNYGYATQKETKLHVSIYRENYNLRSEKQFDIFVENNKYKNITIYADVLEISAKKIRIRQNLTIYARHIIISTSGSTIDGRGENGGDFDGKRAEHGHSGEPKVENNERGGKKVPRITVAEEKKEKFRKLLHGENGLNGDPGKNGHIVSIYAQSITGGKLTVDVRGGKGGKGQDGGNGASPKYKNETHVSDKHKEARLTFREKRTAKYGPRIPRTPHRYFTLMNDSQPSLWDFLAAKLAPETKAFNGGNAGHPGKSGISGNGGNVYVNIAAEQKHNNLDIKIDGGLMRTRKESAKAGIPGAPGPQAGLGLSWFVYADKDDWDTNHDNRGTATAIKKSKSDVCRLCKEAVVNDAYGHDNKLRDGRSRLHKDFFIKGGELLDRPPEKTFPGRPGSYGRQSKVNPAGRAGRKGKYIDNHPIPATDDPLYLELLLNRAELADFAGDVATGRSIRLWIVKVTDNFKKQTPGLKHIKDRTQSAIVAMANVSHPVENQCIEYMNAMDCVNLAEAYLDKLIGMEKRHDAAVSHAGAKEERIRRIDAALAENKYVAKHHESECKRLDKSRRRIAKEIIDLDLNLFLLKKQMAKQYEKLKAEQAHFRSIDQFNEMIDTVFDIVDVTDFGFSFGQSMIDYRKAVKRERTSFENNFSAWKNKGGKETVAYYMDPKIDGLSKEKRAEYIKNSFLRTDTFKSGYAKAYQVDKSKKNKAFNSIFAAGFKPGAYYSIYKLSKGSGSGSSKSPSLEERSKGFDAAAQEVLPDSILMELKLARSNFKAFLTRIKKADSRLTTPIEFQRLFDDYFTYGEAKVHQLQQLAKLNTARRAIRFQKKLNVQKASELKRQRTRLQVARRPDEILLEKSAGSVQDYYRNILKSALELIKQEREIFRVLRLEEPEGVDLDLEDFNGQSLKEKFHDSLAAEIANEVAKAEKQTGYSVQTYKGTPFTYKPSEEVLDRLKSGEFVRIPITLTNAFQIRKMKVLDVQAYLVGATADSDFYYVLEHRGTNHIPVGTRKIERIHTYNLPPHRVTRNYSVSWDSRRRSWEFGDAKNKMESVFPGAESDIGYSPFGDWYLQVKPNHTHTGAYTYNKSINWEKFSHISIVFKLLQKVLPED